MRFGKSVQNCGLTVVELDRLLEQENRLLVVVDKGASDTANEELLDPQLLFLDLGVDLRTGSEGCGCLLAGKRRRTPADEDGNQ